MKWTNFSPKHSRNACVWLGAMTMLLGSAILVQAASSSTPSSSVSGVGQSQKAARLVRDIKADAVKARVAAARLDTLAESANAKWLDYDRQWNEIKPLVEDMQMKLARLERMQSTLSPAERTELDQVKPLVGAIQSRTHQFLTLLDTPGVQTNDPKFKAYAKGLRSEADKLEKLAPAA
jgi:hypothetical protein